jgi:hypothetical protein
MPPPCERMRGGDTDDGPSLAAVFTAAHGSPVRCSSTLGSHKISHATLRSSSRVQIISAIRRCLCELQIRMSIGFYRFSMQELQRRLTQLVNNLPGCDT